jgi:hypothetical protein
MLKFDDCARVIIEMNKINTQNDIIFFIISPLLKKIKRRKSHVISEMSDVKYVGLNVYKFDIN